MTQKKRMQDELAISRLVKELSDEEGRVNLAAYKIEAEQGTIGSISEDEFFVSYELLPDEEDSFDYMELSDNNVETILDILLEMKTDDDLAFDRVQDANYWASL